MNYEELFSRILKRVDSDAYLASTEAIDARQQAAIAEIEASRRDPSQSADQVRALIRRLHADGRIDQVLMYSALHVLAASPKVKDYAEAAAMAAAQEMAALQLGGPRLQHNLASVERHRGVLAFLSSRYDVALDYFSRAFEREHSATNLSNVLATLLRLGDVADAEDLLRQVRSSFPAAMVAELDGMIAADPDLALLRTQPHADRADDDRRM